MLDIKGTYYTREEKLTVIYIIKDYIRSFIMSTSFFDAIKESLYKYIPCDKCIKQLDYATIDNLNPDISNIRTISIHVSEKCNLQCKHCYAVASTKGQFLTLEKFSSILAKLNHLGKYNLRITGGEPTLNPNIIEICNAAMAIKAVDSHYLLTNATANHSLFESIILTGIKVQVSLYGFSPSSFSDFTRRPHSLHKNVINNLKLIPQKYRDIVKIVFYNVSNSNYELENFIAFAKNFGFRYIIGKINYLGRATQNYTIDDLSTTDLHLESRHQKSQLAYRFCEPDIISMNIDGDISPCPLINYKEISYGNIFHQTIDEIIASTARRHYLNHCIDDVKGCSSCPVRYLCSGGCYALTKSITGSMFNQFPYCRFHEIANQIDESHIYSINKITPGLFYVKTYK